MDVLLRNIKNLVQELPDNRLYETGDLVNDVYLALFENPSASDEEILKAIKKYSSRKYREPVAAYRSDDISSLLSTELLVAKEHQESPLWTLLLDAFIARENTLEELNDYYNF